MRLFPDDATSGLPTNRPESVRFPLPMLRTIIARIDVAYLGYQARAAGFSGDGSEVWRGGGDVGMRLRMLPLTGGTPRNFLGEETVNLAWSPDGERIVYHTFGGGDPVFVANRNGANARQIFVDRPGIHNHFPTWSPDGRWIYFVHGTPDTRDMDLWRVDPAGGNPADLRRHQRRKAKRFRPGNSLNPIRAASCSRALDLECAASLPQTRCSRHLGPHNVPLSQCQADGQVRPSAFNASHRR